MSYRDPFNRLEQLRNYEQVKNKYCELHKLLCNMTSNPPKTCAQHVVQSTLMHAQLRSYIVASNKLMTEYTKDMKSMREQIKNNITDIPFSKVTYELLYQGQTKTMEDKRPCNSQTETPPQTSAQAACKCQTQGASNVTSAEPQLKYSTGARNSEDNCLETFNENFKRRYKCNHQNMKALLPLFKRNPQLKCELDALKDAMDKSAANYGKEILKIREDLRLAELERRKELDLLLSSKRNNETNCLEHTETENVSRRSELSRNEAYVGPQLLNTSTCCSPEYFVSHVQIVNAYNFVEDFKTAADSTKEASLINKLNQCWQLNKAAPNSVQLPKQSCQKQYSNNPNSPKKNRNVSFADYAVEICDSKPLDESKNLNATLHGTNNKAQQTSWPELQQNILTEPKHSIKPIKTDKVYICSEPIDEPVEECDLQTEALQMNSNQYKSIKQNTNEIRKETAIQLKNIKENSLDKYLTVKQQLKHAKKVSEKTALLEALDQSLNQVEQPNCLTVLRNNKLQQNETPALKALAQKCISREDTINCVKEMTNNTLQNAESTALPKSVDQSLNQVQQSHCWAQMRKNKLQQLETTTLKKPVKMSINREESVNCERTPISKSLGQSLQRDDQPSSIAQMNKNKLQQLKTTDLTQPIEKYFNREEPIIKNKLQDNIKTKLLDRSLNRVEQPNYWIKMRKNKLQQIERPALKESAKKFTNREEPANCVKPITKYTLRDAKIPKSWDQSSQRDDKFSNKAQLYKNKLQQVETPVLKKPVENSSNREEQASCVKTIINGILQDNDKIALRTSEDKSIYYNELTSSSGISRYKIAAEKYVLGLLKKNNENVFLEEFESIKFPNNKTKADNCSELTSSIIPEAKDQPYIEEIQNISNSKKQTNSTNTAAAKIYNTNYLKSNTVNVPPNQAKVQTVKRNQVCLDKTKPIKYDTNNLKTNRTISENADKPNKSKQSALT